MQDETSPSSVENQYQKALMAVEKKNYPYAIELLTHAINIKPDFAKARQLIRIAQIKKNDEHPPNPIIGAINRLSSYIRVFTAAISESKGDNQKAISIYEKALKKDPKNVTVMVKLGGLLKDEGLKEGAAVTLEIAITISENNTAALGLLGDIYSDTGNYKRASSCYKKVLGLKPDDTHAERGLKNLDALTTIDKL